MLQRDRFRSDTGDYSTVHIIWPFPPGSPEQGTILITPEKSFPPAVAAGAAEEESIKPEIPFTQ
jgi:hypothetical protein